MDASPPTNYERAILDWNTTANVFTIGTQAGGTGTVVRPMQLVGIPTKTTPVSADQILLQDSASSNTLKWANWSSLPSGGGGGMSIGGVVTGGTDLSVLFVHPAGTLAQDNPHFTFDPVTNYLNVGVAGDTGIYYINGVPAVYQVANASGTNWFEGNSGNRTLTGYGNFGTGDTALSSITTGYNNFAIGTDAMQIATTAYQNTAVGIRALYNLTSGSNNAAIGSSALQSCTTGIQNTAVGTRALFSLTTGNNNIALGQTTLFNATAPVSVVAIGVAAYGDMTSGLYSCAIGESAGQHVVSGNGNNLFGAYAGQNLTGGSYNTLVGGWNAAGGAFSNVIAITDGYGSYFGTSIIMGVDFNYTLSKIWSFQKQTTPIGLHVYNTTDGAAPPTNYERACLDWNLTSNVFRIASQAGAGGSVVRLIAIDGFQKAGAPAAGDLPSGTMALINDTSGGQTWLCYNSAGTIRKVQLT
jgi:hypothetical protein